MNYNPPRKPRQTRGTPAHAVTNRIAFGVLGFGVAFGFLYHFTAGQSFINRLKDGYGIDFNAHKSGFIPAKNFTKLEENEKKLN